MSIDSKERFTSRADVYAKYRPEYPEAAVSCIIDNAGVDAQSSIADIGAGTGKFTKLLLARGLRVKAVEPNDKMREAAIAELAGKPGFTAIKAAAEETGLEESSIDLITTAQAFHWFDRPACKREWKRILKPAGHVALIWNRADASCTFMQGYHQAIKQFPGDHPSDKTARITSSVLDEFFANYETFHFKWSQTHTFDELLGRALSSSTAPLPGHTNYQPLSDALKTLFDECNKDGQVSFDYDTELFFGQI